MKSENKKRKVLVKASAGLSGAGLSDELVVYDLTGPTHYNDDQAVSHSLCLFQEKFENNADIDMSTIAEMPYGFDQDIDIFDWCAVMLSHSPTASRLWRSIANEGWSVGLSDIAEGGFSLDLTSKVLLLDHFVVNPSALGRSAYFRNSLLLDLVRALRDIDHELKQRSFEENFKPEDVLMQERVRAADCDTLAVLVAWELRGAGFSDIWRHMIGSPEGDMAMAFSRFLERDPSALFNGTALVYAFRQWYADAGRVNGCDHDTLEMLDDVLLDATEHNPFGSQQLSGEIIEAIAVLPNDTHYLKNMGETIRRDPFFAGMNDPINQAHLFHIVYDMEVTMINNVPFRDAGLASKIFPSDLIPNRQR